MGEKTALITWTTGVPDGIPVVLLHDRYRDHDELDALARDLAATHRVVAVRSARTQMENTLIKGYYWFLGPFERPELSTLGDGLHHLERLLLQLTEGGGKVHLAGIGEGGTMALIMALVWPDLVASVASLDGPLPDTIDSLPLQLGSADGLAVLLAESTRDLGPSAAALTGRGAAVTHQGAGAPQLGQIAAFVLEQSATA